MKSKSFIKVITVFFSVTYFVMLLLMGVSISFTLKNITINVIDSVSRELSQEQSRIAKEMDSCERFLLTFSSGSSDIGTITLNQRDAAYYSSLYRVKTEFADVLSSMEYTDGLFVIPCEGQDFIYSYRGGDESFLDIRRYVRNSIDSGEIESLPGRYWNLINTEGNYYLIFVYKAGKVYTGAWTSLKTIIPQKSEDNSFESLMLLSTADKIYGLEGVITASEVIHSVRKERISLLDKYIAIKEDMECLKDGEFVALVPSIQIVRTVIPNILILMLLAFIIIASTIIAIYLLRMYFRERIAQQEMHYKSLKNQIAPHFLINCLNLVYHLAANGRYKEIQDMTVVLGKHLRYALVDVDTVTLEEELEQVRNYVKLSLIRYPGSISLYESVPEGFKDIKVIPMLILFQVENIIKYEVVNGEDTQIHIEVEDYLSEKRKPMHHFTIWDNGAGYTLEVLRQLQGENMLDWSDGHNIGTKNIYKRLQLRYNKEFKMEFSNRDNAGAQIDIYIPYEDRE